ncbi:beta-galactosidase BglB [Halomonas sp. V046]|uniref:beta-galactosidase BglB n=1 Tax=Halomonas sp. V046 TaxID=3459611 RepID=UPI0040450F98
MTVYPVKHSPLLRQKERFSSRNEIVGLIDKIIDNLIHIEDTSGEFLIHLDDGRSIDTKGWTGWEWTHGVGLYGIYRFYELTGETQHANIIDDWFTAHFAQPLATKNVNTVAPFLTLAYRVEETGNLAWRPYLEAWADWVMNDMPRTDRGGMQHVTYHSENHQQLWDDTLMMCVLPLLKIGKLLGREDYVDEAKFQCLTHVQYLMDRETGAWFHGWTFDGHHNYAKARWARGNSWLTIAIPDLLELLDLPERDPFRRYMVEVLTAQVEALAEWQDESGLWHTLLDDDGSYPEASATAGFAYGILKAVRLRYLDPSHYAMGEKAVQGVVRHIGTDGELQQVSFGTAMGDTLDFYREIPLTSMPYGQAMAILCLTEYLRTYL